MIRHRLGGLLFKISRLDNVGWDYPSKVEYLVTAYPIINHISCYDWILLFSL